MWVQICELQLHLLDSVTTTKLVITTSYCNLECLPIAFLSTVSLIPVLTNPVKEKNSVAIRVYIHVNVLQSAGLKRQFINVHVHVHILHYRRPGVNMLRYCYLHT